MIIAELGQARALRAAALLLGYPDDELFARLPVVRAATATLNRPHLARFVTHLESTPRDVLERDYVDTFDLRRRCCLYLTYYSYGDTRKRGMALLRFTHAYKTAGFELVGGELPDHLGVVCEFAAARPKEGLRLLAEQRAGVELLRIALADAGSAYVEVVDGIRAVLPDPAPKDLERALTLARTGPPAEEVGLEPFGPEAAMTGARR